MTEVQILDIMYEAFQLAMKLSLPFLLISMIVGVVIAIFQAATQIICPQAAGYYGAFRFFRKFYAGHASGIFSIHSGIDRKGVKKIYVYHIFNGSDAYERSHRIQSPFWKK